jgi:MFS transporter, ACDE family, multidrug resistance protein
VERPVASAAYSFVRFIGGGIAPYVAGRLVLALNIHVPFFIAAGALCVGIAVLATAHRLLGDAERVQAQRVTADPAGTRAVPEPSLVPVAGTSEAGLPDDAGVIVAAIDSSPVGVLVTEAAGWLAAMNGRAVHLVHAQEGVTAGETGVEGEDLDAAKATVAKRLRELAAHRVPAVGQVLLHAADHGAAGRLVAEYANDVRATTIVLGAPSHGGLPALMDASASRELWRHVRSNVVIINPDAAPDPEPVVPRASARAREA